MGGEERRGVREEDSGGVRPGSGRQRDASREAGAMRGKVRYLPHSAGD